MTHVFLLVCFVAFFFSNAPPSEQIENGIIPLNSTLLANGTAKQTWVSANSTFTLGFFTPSNVSGSIFAIWYANISKLTVVWMANRDAPVDAHAYFQLTPSGQFMLYNGSGAVAWATPINRTSVNNSVRGEFQQSGNLLLRNRASNIVVWQSFDYPTDTLLPGQRYGVRSSSLRSWRISDSDPTTGNFMLVMNSSNNLEMYFTLTGAEYWTSDRFSLINSPSGSAVAELNQTGALNIAVNSTVLQTYTASDLGSRRAVLRRLTLNAEGNLAMYSWSEAEAAWVIVWRALTDACTVRGVCGNGICTSPNASDLSQYACSCPQGFLRNDLQDWTLGCFRALPLISCSNSTSAPSNASLTTQMLAFDHVNYLGPATFVDHIASAADCGAVCLQNCSCVCASYATDGSEICWIHSDMHYGAQSDPNQTYTFLLKLSAPLESHNISTPAKHRGFHSRPAAATIAAACSASGLAATVLLIGLLAWLITKKREQSRLQRSWSLRRRSGLPIKFSYKELETATDNFKHKLGSGGFGTVFKGVLAGDQSTVAVKKLHSSSEQGGGEAQFQAEVSTIGSIHHQNIVRLRGFCCEGSHRILVYEYMEKGSLDRYLTDRSKERKDQLAIEHQALDWNTRFNIALGVAKGIAYCHEQCRCRIIHCDIKPENVLLQDDFCPKVSDFGLAKLVSKSQTRVVTAIRGTRGYVAPEWVANLPVSVRADVYSYGMLLLEVIGWRRNLDLCVASLDKFYYPDWAFQRLMEGDLVEVAKQANITQDFDKGQVERALDIAFWCIQDESSVRPSMGMVVQMLEGTLPVSKPPRPKVLEIVMHEMRDESVGNTLISSVGDAIEYGTSNLQSFREEII